MTSPKQPGDGKPGVSWQRMAIWLIVAGIGAFLMISGIVGIITKG